MCKFQPKNVSEALYYCQQASAWRQQSNTTSPRPGKSSLLQKCYLLPQFITRDVKIVDRIILHRPSDRHPAHHQLFVSQPKALLQHFRVACDAHLQAAPKAPLSERQHEDLDEHPNTHRIYRRLHELCVHADDGTARGTEEFVVAPSRFLGSLTIFSRDVVSFLSVQEMTKLTPELHELLG